MDTDDEDFLGASLSFNPDLPFFRFDTEEPQGWTRPNQASAPVQAGSSSHASGFQVSCPPALNAGWMAWPQPPILPLLPNIPPPAPHSRPTPLAITAATRTTSTSDPQQQPTVTTTNRRYLLPRNIAVQTSTGFMSLAASIETRNGDLSRLTQASASPEPSDNDPAKHRRNYQACERCRIRKVKCELGPVDAPHAPPCAKCRRENKSCEFADTRKKRKGSPDGSEAPEEREPDKRRRTISDSQASGSPFTPATLNNGYSPSPGIANLQAEIQPRASQPPTTLHRKSSNRRQPFAPPPAQIPRSAIAGAAQSSMKIDSNEEYQSTAAHDFMHVNVTPATTQDKLSFFQRVAEPKLGQNETATLSPAQQQERERGRQVWNSMSFVRDNVFTAEEAMGFVENFYTRLQPMTPVVTPNYRSPLTHHELLRDEPILALAILTISSRYYLLEDPLRSFNIHENLWKSLTSKVQRLLWAQEQFGGRYTRAGAPKVRESAGGQLTWPGSLRTLGTIEALLLLTDWQPRALHFPPGNDDIILLDNSFYNTDDSRPQQSNGQATQDSQDSIPYANWLEPAWRSDRMSWMLLGLAQALSFELGVFDRQNDQPESASTDPDWRRKLRIRRMVLVYVSQISGRIGIPSPLTMETWIDWTGNGPIPGKLDRVDVMHGLWTHIAGIMSKANREIFPSRDHTMKLAQGTGYQKAIATFAPLLQEWKHHYERVSVQLEPHMQHILMMEYEYARLYINSIGLQHVVESWVRQDSNSRQVVSDMARHVGENKRYINEFTDAALHILEILSGGMAKLGAVKDAPVRTFLRTLSAMMFTLKRLSMGNHEKVVRRSIELLENVVKLLEEEVGDSVHLSRKAAQMINSILHRVKGTLIRVQKPPNLSNSLSRNPSRTATPQPKAREIANHQDYFDASNQGYATGLSSSSHAFSRAPDPLAGIAARPMAELRGQTFIPPPNYNPATNEFDMMIDDSAIDHSVGSDLNADWLAMPLDPLMDNAPFRNDQGFQGIGPMRGQHELLQALLPLGPGTMSWNGPDQSYQDFGGM